MVLSCKFSIILTPYIRMTFNAVSIALFPYFVNRKLGNFIFYDTYLHFIHSIYRLLNVLIYQKSQ